MPKDQYHTTPEEREERVGESSESEDEDADWENEGGATDEGPQESLEAD